MRSTTARRNKNIQSEQQANVTVPSVEVHESVFDPTWQNQPIAENFGDEEAIAPPNAQVVVEEKTPASTGQKQGSFKVGDRVCYQSSPDRPMEVIELCENGRLKLCRWDNAEVWGDAVLLQEWVEAIAPDNDPPESFPFYFYPDFLTPEQADLLLSQSEALEWQNNTIRMYGKRIPLPRLEAMYGDAGCSYTYSNSVLLEPLPWVEPLADLRDHIQQVTGRSYQIAIGNQYRDGSDHIGWHSDDSPELGESPAIASISLGATRHFKIRHKTTKEVHEFDLTHGSLLVMHPGCQTDWQHCITKTSKDVGMRINWTFRPHLNGAPAGTSEAIAPAPTHQLEALPVEVLDLTESDRLIESLYQQLQQAEAEANAAFKNATSKYFDLGIELLKRRPEFPRGTWLAWLAERGINEKYAQRAMQIGKHFGEKSDSLSDMSIEDALRQIQKKLPSVDGYTFEEVKAEYEAIAPHCFKFHRGAAHPYSFEVQGFSSYFHSLSQAMERLPALRKKYGRIAEYQSVDEPLDPPEEEMGGLIAKPPKPIYQVGDRLTSKSGETAELVAIDGDTLVINQQQENGVVSSRVPIAKADKNWQLVAEKKLTGTDAQTLKDLCEFHGLREVAIAVLLSATLDQLDELGNWISERQLQLE